MRRIRPWQVGSGVLLVLAPAAFAGLAGAAEDPSVIFPDCGRTDNIEAAKIAHKAASQLFEREEWDRAIENWRDTYKLDCKAHGVLINAASAYEKKGDKESAIAMLEAYLRRAPNAPDITNVVQKIDALRTSLPPKVEPVPTAVPTAIPTATATASVSVRPPPLLKPHRPYGAKPWFVVGAGSVAVLTGAILVPIGLGAIADAEAACGGRACGAAKVEVASEGNTGRAQVIAGDIVLSMGVAAVAGGLVWQLVLNKPRLMKEPDETQDPAAAPVTFAPVVRPGFGGVAVTGRF